MGYQIRHESRDGERYVTFVLVGEPDEPKPLPTFKPKSADWYRPHDRPTEARCRAARSGSAVFGSAHVSKGNGYLQLRRGVFEHVRDGRMTMTEAFCYIYMLTQADTRTGIWNGSAGSLSGELAMPQRTARNILEALDRRYIKRFATPGRHSCYPIALHKFLVTDGEHKSEHLNALESKSPIDLRYFSRQQMGEQEGEHIGQHMAAQKRIENRNKKQTPSPLASQEGFEAFYKEYPRKELQPGPVALGSSQTRGRTCRHGWTRAVQAQ